MNIFCLDKDPKIAVAIAQDQKCRQLPNFETLSVVEKYREYYNHDKSYMAKWQYSETPKWYTVKY